MRWALRRSIKCCIQMRARNCSRINADTSVPRSSNSGWPKQQSANWTLSVKLKQVYLTAADPEALAAFYKALGLTVRFADQGKWIQFGSEKTAFCVASRPESVSDPSSNAVLV